MAAFFSDTTNAQLLEFRPEATLLAISEADQIDMKGIEADITAAVTRALTMQVAVGYTDTKINEFSGAPAIEGVARLDYTYTGKPYWDWADTEGCALSAGTG
jgi:hypothetical protein